MEMLPWNRRNRDNQSGWSTSGRIPIFCEGISRVIVASYTLTTGHVDFRMMA
jgi:hypothetical protein